MSDAVDDFRALKQHRREDRAEAWERRGFEWFEPLQSAGFSPVIVDVASRHCRVSIRGHGWFDFWPSTGRWSESPRKGGRRGRHGHGVTDLIAALRDPK